MAKDPAARHQTAQDLGQSLQQAQVALGLPMTEMTMLGPPAARSAGGSPGGAPPANRRPLVIAAIAVVAVIAVVAFSATRGGGLNVAASTTTTTARQATTTTTATNTTLPPSGGSTVLLTNQGGQLEVSVPTSWSAHDTATTSDGSPELQASTDLTEFRGVTFRQPGIDFAAFPASTVDPSNLEAVLDKIIAIDRSGSTLATLCSPGTRTAFTPNGAGLSAGRFERLMSCNGGNGGGDVIIIVATNTNLTFTVVIEVHVGNPPDDAGVDAVTSSFNVVKFP
jgi:hypothetical protein